MTATLLVAIPLALLGVVALLGFVGCVLPVGGLPGGPVTHTDPYDDMMKKETDLVAFWTLTEGSGAASPTEQINNFTSKYATGFGMKSYNGGTKSAGNAGNVTAGQPGIVLGDALDGVQDFSTLFDGGMVFVEWQQAINALTTFTVEAWVKPAPSWQSEQPSLRGVVASNHTGPFQGFGLFANTDNVTKSNNFWQFSLGTGTQQVGPTVPDDFTKPVYHLVGTLDDKGVATLYVNGSPSPPVNLGSTYVPLPNGTQLFIGAGLPQLGTSSAPQLPLVGNVQCVAIYKSALGAGTIQTHFSTGMTAAG